MLILTTAIGGAADSAVRVDVDFDGIVRTLNATMFGVNTAIWDATLDTPDSIASLREAAPLALRFPGGSIADQYHWASNTSVTASWLWPTSFKNFMHVATNLQAQVVSRASITSYGTPEEARHVGPLHQCHQPLQVPILGNRQRKLRQLGTRQQRPGA